MAKDKIVLINEVEQAETVRLIAKASIRDLSSRSSIDLEQALTIAKTREHIEAQAKKDMEKKLAMPLKKLNESVSEMEAVKTKIALAENSDLMFLDKNYEETYKKYKEAEAEVKKLDCNFSGMGYDPLPTNITERLHWLSKMREIWKRKV